MKQSFILRGLKPLSINSTYYRTFNGVVKTSAATEWTYTVFYLLDLQENKEKLKALRELFDPSIHSYAFNIRVLYPKNVFITKKGTVSSKTIDVTNFEKSLVDCFCLARHFSNPAPSGCENLNTDDRYVTEMHSMKGIAEDGEPRIEVDVEIKNRYP